MHKSFWWWQCSDRYLITSPPPFPLPPFSPSLINLTVFVDVKHHVYIWNHMIQGRRHTPTIAYRYLPPKKDVVNQCLEFGAHCICSRAENSTVWKQSIIKLLRKGVIVVLVLVALTIMKIGLAVVFYRFYIALFSALKQTHCAHLWFYMSE